MSIYDAPLENLDLTRLSRKERRALGKEMGRKRRRVFTVRDALNAGLISESSLFGQSFSAPVEEAPLEELGPPQVSWDTDKLERWATQVGLQSLLDDAIGMVCTELRYAWYGDSAMSRPLRTLFDGRLDSRYHDQILRLVVADLQDLHRTSEHVRARIPEDVEHWRGAKVPAALVPVRDHLVAAYIQFAEAHAPIWSTDHLTCRIYPEEMEIRNQWMSLELDGLILRADSTPTRAMGAIAAALDRLTDVDDEIEQLAALMTMAPWERRVRRMSDALAEAPDDSDKPLLGWHVQFGETLVLRALRCRQTKRGTSYVTKRVAAHEIPAALATEPADLDVLDVLWRGEGPKTPLVDRLRGHPRVFVGKSKRPSIVRRGVLQLGVRETSKGFVLRLEIDGDPVPADTLSGGTGANWDAGFLVEHREEAIRVTRVPSGVRRQLRRLSPFLDAPFDKRARTMLLAELPRLARSLPLAADASLRGTAVTADERPIYQLSWDGETLSVAARVRPLPECAPQAPGQGSETLMAFRGDSVVHVHRDLDAEVRDVTSMSSSLGLPESPEHQWHLGSPDAALPVIAALQEAADAVRVSWSGARVRMLGTAEAQDLMLRVRPSTDWLGIEGGLTLAGQDVKLRALLEAALAGHEHVQVADGAWVAIEATLRERLALAASVSGARKGAEPKLSTLHAPALAALEQAGVSIEGSGKWRDLAERARAASTHDPVVPTGLNATLRDYQLTGFRWMSALATWAPGACLADDMGLGKTVQTLTLLLEHASRGPSLVVAPTSVCMNWQREASRFAPSLECVVYRGSDRERLLDGIGPGTLVICSYGILVRDADRLAEQAFNVVVLDEAQAIKNAATARAKAARRLQAEFRVALTGTPVENHTGELYSLMQFTAPGLLGSATGFKERFVGPIDGKGDHRRRSLLARLVGPFVLRRTKREVARELPARTEQVVRIVPTAEEKNLYERARLEAVARATVGGKGQRMQILAELQRLRQLACHPRLVDPGSRVASSKLNAVVRVMEDLRSSGHRALIFSSFTRHLGLIREALEGAGFSLRYLDGKTPVEQRQKEVDAFQDGTGDAFLISLKAGGTGLNLTGATYVLHLDPWWNPAAEDQATDRAHRIGQTQAVTVYRFVMAHTVEEQILALHARKRELAEALLSGSGDASHISAEDLLALMQEAQGPTDSLPVSARPIQRGKRFTDFVEAFGQSLEQSVEGGALKRSSARAYLGALRRLGEARATDDTLDSAACLAFLNGHIDPFKKGEIGTKSDKTLGPTAIRRMVQWMAET